MEYFSIQVQRVAPLLGCHARTPEGRCEQSIRRALAHGKGMTKRQAQRFGNADADIFNKVWTALLKKRVIIPDTDKTPCQTFRLRVATQKAEA